jgi:GAF domain
MTLTKDPFDGRTYQRGLHLVAPLDPGTLSRNDVAEQLHTVHALSVAGTRRDPVFDLLADLTASQLNAPVAIVSLVDEDRLWFEAMFGLEGSSNPPTGLSCDWVAYRGGFFEVPDVATDPRFADGTVARAGLISYAGMPIFGVDGHPVGSLVVLNIRPRWLTSDERRRLGQMAALVNGHLHLRHARGHQKPAAGTSHWNDEPMLSLPDAETVGSDALARWRHRTGERVPEEAFFDVAERNDPVLDLARPDDPHVTAQDDRLSDEYLTANVADLVPPRIETAVATVMNRLRELGFSPVLVDAAETPPPDRHLSRPGTTQAPKPY